MLQIQFRCIWGVKIQFFVYEGLENAILYMGPRAGMIFI